MSGVRHIHRPTPPWARGTNIGQCGRTYPVDRTIPWSEWDKILAEAVPARRYVALLSDTRMATICKNHGICVTCGKTARHASSWDRDPLHCLQDYAETVRGARNADLQLQARCELAALVELVAADQDRFDDIVRRNKTLALLAGPSGAMLR